MAQTNQQDPVQHLRTILRENPRLFRDHPELLEELDLGPGAEATVVSLEHARALQLQRRIAHLEEDLERLVGTARDNDRVATHLHRLTIDLLGSQDQEELVHTLLEGVRENFRVDAVGLRVDQDELAGQLDDRFLAPLSWIRNRFVTEDRVSLGPVQDPAVARALYGDELTFQSHALVPLREGTRLFGLLGLASREASRFEPGMGTTYLERLAELAGVLLAGGE
ncbi:DUF484 family protein [Thiohalorhabdus methylotrophus]|uniref:DUF484 family protein n=1 Tax=Thiohalorhabdus methylotrophus TaxID=3242694 RepID=A0ABV4TTD2_9GAMM